MFRARNETSCVHECMTSFRAYACICAWICICTCRVDRSRWNPAESIVNKIDAHVLNDAYRRSEWNRMTHLLVALHGKVSENYTWTMNYHEKFNKLLDISRMTLNH